MHLGLGLPLDAWTQVLVATQKGVLPSLRANLLALRVHFILRCGVAHCWKMNGNLCPARGMVNPMNLGCKLIIVSDIPRSLFPTPFTNKGMVETLLETFLTVIKDR